MAADITFLTRMYRRLARINAGESLPAQLAWLEASFVAKATQADDGDVNAASQSYQGSAAAYIYRGSTAEERAEALDDAMRQIEEAIAEVMPRSAPGMLTPVFHSSYIPR